MSIPIEIALWDADQIGEYILMAPRTVAEKIAVRPGFPKPILLGTGSRRTRRWKAKEIIEWAESRQQK